MSRRSTAIGWKRLTGGLIILGGIFLFFASGIFPPGICGEVLRHNREYGIDASPLFYSEVENMSDYEDSVARMRLEAESRTMEENGNN